MRPYARVLRCLLLSMRLALLSMHQPMRPCMMFPIRPCTYLASVGLAIAHACDLKRALPHAPHDRYHPWPLACCLHSAHSAQRGQTGFGPSLYVIRLSSIISAVLPERNREMEMHKEPDGSPIAVLTHEQFLARTVFHRYCQANKTQK